MTGDTCERAGGASPQGVGRALRRTQRGGAQARTAWLQRRACTDEGHADSVSGSVSLWPRSTHPEGSPCSLCGHRWAVLCSQAPAAPRERVFQPVGDERSDHTDPCGERHSVRDRRRGGRLPHNGRQARGDEPVGLHADAPRTQDHLDHHLADAPRRNGEALPLLRVPPGARFDQAFLVVQEEGLRFEGAGVDEAVGATSQTSSASHQ